ncbi:helix-turn-helix domain-containing protein [Aureimonas leprariae]|uniref:Helix-turn-helix transcriptional regulator n=1 Tax=Plantimonas leprariae TaxID=2615207 RepID=A0A7V7PLU3_9HYPH|nr:AraC family transcriptional regulator [Aureimonas leprariae]KAB0677537.1 helix-turn-helix transcriptional regulator [Aureimonas leprariae]
MRPLFEKQPIPDGQSWRFFDRRLADGIPFIWHYHREYELTLTLNSVGQRFVGDHVGPYGDRDLVLLGPDIPHTWSSTAKLDEAAPHVALVMFFRAEWIDGLMKAMPELAPLSSMLAASRRGLRFSAGAIEAARPAVEAMRHLAPAARLFRLLELLVLLAEDRGCEPLASPEAQQSPLPGDERPRLERVLDHIHAHYGQRLRIDDLADLAHLSASGLHRMFKRHVGQTVTDYVGQLRIGRACQLLIASDMPIAHVASDAGYANLSLFNRQFQRARGETPRSFRRNFRRGMSFKNMR